MNENERALARAFVSMFLLVAASGAFAAGPAGEQPNADDKMWLLPQQPPAPSDNEPNAERVALGKKLFFEKRLSVDGSTSCASCHDPSKGWSDGLPSAHGLNGKVLARATPTIYNAAYNSIQMWDGRKATLEDQALGPMESPAEMATDFAAALKYLKGDDEYRKLFAKAYPGEAIDKPVLAKAIASFERTVVSRSSPFDRWLNGDNDAMTPAQIRGFRLFVDKTKGNCAACHQPPNFTDNGFHNIGLASYGKDNPDLGRFAQKPLAVLKGAFKTPTLRNVALTAPYFHDGSAATLEEVVAHYARGGVAKDNLDSNIKPLSLTAEEKGELVEFMKALTDPGQPATTATSN